MIFNALCNENKRHLSKTHITNIKIQGKNEITEFSFVFKEDSSHSESRKQQVYLSVLAQFYPMSTNITLEYTLKLTLECSSFKKK